MDYEQLVKTIDSLPPLSDSAMLIQKLYDEGAENVDIIKLVRIIESDALLAANILKMINAPFYGFSNKIASVAQAVSLFGTYTVYGLVTNYAMQEKIQAQTSSYNITSMQFNEMCQMQSHLMMQWYSKIDLRHAQFLAPLALIMEAGKLVLANEVAQSENSAAFKQGVSKSSNIQHFEYDFFGTTSYYVSGLLFEHWNLEPLYVKMLKNLDIEEEDIGSKMEYYIDTLDVVRTAVNVNNILTEKSIAEASLIVQDMNLDHFHFEKVANRIKASFEKKRKQ